MNLWKLLGIRTTGNIQKYQMKKFSSFQVKFPIHFYTNSLYLMKNEYLSTV